MLIIFLILVFSLATIHFSHVLFSLCLLSQSQLPKGVILLRSLALCIMAACAQYYALSLILGSNLPTVSGLVLVITNTFFFIGFFSAYKVKHTKES
jgi:hypothetical protein